MPGSVKLDIFVKEGTHSTVDDINKQINDKVSMSYCQSGGNRQIGVNGRKDAKSRTEVTIEMKYKNSKWELFILISDLIPQPSSVHLKICANCVTNFSDLVPKLLISSSYLCRYVLSFPPLYVYNLNITTL